MFRLRALEAALQEKDQKLSQQTEKLQKLKDDFKYNLKLLEDRDQELERYDIAFTGSYSTSLYSLSLYLSVCVSVCLSLSLKHISSVLLLREKI